VRAVRPQILPAKPLSYSISLQDGVTPPYPDSDSVTRSKHTAQFELTSRAPGHMLARMRSRVSSFVALCALAICLSGQTAEMFDRWDHTAQTGSDTEYTFVVLALCVGVSYSLRWFAPEIRPPGHSAVASPRPSLDVCASFSIRATLPLFTIESPPAVSLRI
jgi:hypothetical protein